MHNIAVSDVSLEATFTSRPGLSRTTMALVAAVAVLLGVVYYLTFKGSKVVEAQRNPIVFADSSHYIELLSGAHYLDCIALEPAHQIEHRRKTVHHVGYLLFGDIVARTAELFSGVSQIELIWLISPVLGAVSFLLAFSTFNSSFGQELALPGALMYALTPAIWAYSSIPETWMFVGATVLLVLFLRTQKIAPWIIAVVIACCALANFLLLFLVLLLHDERQSVEVRIRQIVRIGALTVATWCGLLAILGFALSPDFLPMGFVDVTLRFKGRMAENLSIVHPARWAYNGVNGWLAPFVLNQPYLNFGRTAVLDSALRAPLGTAAVVALAVFGFQLVRYQLGAFRANARALGSWVRAISGRTLYLTAIFVATGLALYYESFLYSPLILPFLIGMGLESLTVLKRPAVYAWTVAIVWALNAGEQILRFRGALGL